MENHPGIHTVTRAMEVSCSCREDVDADICDFFSSVIIELGNCEVKDATGGAAEAASMPKKPQTNKRVRFATFSSTMNYCKESPPVNLYYEDAVSSVITKIYKENPFFADDDDDLYSSEYAAAHLQTANLPDDVKTLAINAIEFQLFMGVIMGYMDNVTVSKTRHELLPVDD